MRVKMLLVRALRPFPGLFRFASRVYHRLNGSFRGLSPGATDSLHRALSMVSQDRGEDPGDYYEFGLFRGYTFLQAYRACSQLGLEQAHLYGFDSFEGLPELEDADVGRGDFFKGQFACSREEVERNLAENGMDMKRATLIEGIYSDSLTEELRERHDFRRAAVVFLDCDLYSSTRDALQWSKPYLEEGAILVFDDWYSQGNNDQEGQPKAFGEFLEETGFRAESLWEFPHNGRVFRLWNRQPSE